MRILSVIVLSFAIAACSGGGDGGSNTDSGNNGQTPPADTPAFTLTNENISNSDTEDNGGSWWGENKSKIAVSDTKIFTSIIKATSDSSPYEIVMLEKTIDDGIWTEGISIPEVINTVDILVDSDNYVHILAIVPWTAGGQDGRYVHHTFDNPNTITGTFSTQDAGSFQAYDTSTSTALNYSSKYGAAAIDQDDNIYMVYNSGVGQSNFVSNCQPGGSEQAGPHSISLGIFNGTSWSTEVITNTLPRGFRYPKVVVSDSYIHVTAIEDHWLSSLNTNTGSPAWSTQRYCDFPYIFGEIRYFVRPIGGSDWSSTTLIDLHDGNTITDAYDFGLRLSDMVVSDDKVYVSYKRIDDAVQGTTNGNFNFFFIRATEGSSDFSNEQRIATSTSGGLEGMQVQESKLFRDAEGKVYSLLLGKDLSDLSEVVGLKPLDEGIDSLDTIELDGLSIYSTAIFTAVPEQAGGNASSDTQYFVYYPSNSTLNDLKSKLLKLVY